MTFVYDVFFFRNYYRDEWVTDYDGWQKSKSTLKNKLHKFNHRDCSPSISVESYKTGDVFACPHNLSIKFYVCIGNIQVLVV